MGRLRRSLVAGWLVGLHACSAREPLPETPIIGGSDEQVELARIELAEFDSAIGPGRLRIPWVRFERRDSLGGTGRHTLKIRLDEGLPLEEVRWVLRHELCHALDFEEGLVEQPSELFDTLAVGLFADGTIPVTDYRDPRLRRSEALATFCSRGRLAARALETACGDDPPIVAEVATWLADHVWTRDELLDFPWDPTPAASWRDSGTPVDLRADATRWPPGGLHVSLFAEGVNQAYDSPLLDLRTGDLLPDEEVVELEPATDIPPGLHDHLDDLEHARGWPDGPGAAWGRSHLFHLGWSEWHLFVFDPDASTWQVASPVCALPHLFTDEASMVWTAWLEGAEVSWAPLLPAE